MSTNALAMIVSLNTIFCHCINWCSGERSYEPSMFHNRVERIPIDDHNVPRLRLESDSSQVVSLSISLYCRVTWWKGEKRGRESLPLFSLLITPASVMHVTREDDWGEVRVRITLLLCFMQFLLQTLKWHCLIRASGL